MEIRLQTITTASQNQHNVQAVHVPVSGTIAYENVNTSNLKPTNGIIHILGARF